MHGMFSICKNSLHYKFVEQKYKHIGERQHIQYFLNLTGYYTIKLI